jgi:hypothetical protein
MTEELERHPEFSEEVKGIVFLHDDKRGGIVLHGYEDDSEALSDLFVYLQAVFEANGQTLIVMAAGEG